MPSPSALPAGEIRVWDPFVRLFHWGTVALVIAAFVTQDMKQTHVVIGYALLALVAARLVWGFVGTRHARFTDFVTGPRAVLAYLRGLRTGHPRRYLGHNPAGGAMVVALIVLLLATGVTGWLSQTDRYFGDEIMSGAHSALTTVLLIAVGLHVAGVAVASLLHRENLLRAMFTGRKPAELARQPDGEHGAPASAWLRPH